MPWLSGAAAVPNAHVDVLKKLACVVICPNHRSATLTVPIVTVSAYTLPDHDPLPYVSDHVVPSDTAVAAGVYVGVAPRHALHAGPTMPATWLPVSTSSANVCAVAPLPTVTAAVNPMLAHCSSATEAAERRRLSDADDKGDEDADDEDADDEDADEEDADEEGEEGEEGAEEEEDGETGRGAWDCGPFSSFSSCSSSCSS